LPQMQMDAVRGKYTPIWVNKDLIVAPRPVAIVSRRYYKNPATWRDFLVVSVSASG